MVTPCWFGNLLIPIAPWFHPMMLQQFVKVFKNAAVVECIIWEPSSLVSFLHPYL
jgi:hypothetical protein